MTVHALSKAIYAAPAIFIAGIFISDFFFVESLYLFHKVAICTLSVLGTVGAILKHRKITMLGLIGAWYFFYGIIATAIPDEEYYMQYNLGLPSKEFVVLNLVVLCAVFLASLYIYRMRYRDLKMGVLRNES